MRTKRSLQRKPCLSSVRLDHSEYGTSVANPHLSNCCEPLAGYSLSRTIKEHLGEYSRAFTLSEHPLSKGDITPFVAMFCALVAESLELVCQTLDQKRKALQDYTVKLDEVMRRHSEASEKAGDLAYMLIRAALFADCGVSVAQLGTELHVSRATVYKLMKEASCLLPMKKSRQGKGTLYCADPSAFDATTLS